MNANTFSSILINWRKVNIRELPWKNTKDPYKIWLSEIILQQTRVAQGSPYYQKFIATFPTIIELADANEDEVLKLWEGLGYYSRARNLHSTAKFIVNEYNGIFPKDYSSIIKLKGIGPYTAAAISSFAFEVKIAVVDGNVLRLISRINGIYEDISSNKTVEGIREFVNLGIQKAKASEYNQALMDFGSQVCKPKNPSCSECPFQKYCIAYLKEETKVLPIKLNKIIKRTRYFHFLEATFLDSDKIILEQRMENDVWKKLYQLPLLETNNETIPDLTLIIEKFKDQINGQLMKLVISDRLFSKTQVLTHQKIVSSFYKVHIDIHPNKINKPQYLVERKKVSNFALPKMITEYFSTIKY
jgi:A/G-specific adenine glycosylase